MYYIAVPGEVTKNRGGLSKGSGGRGITTDSKRQLYNRHYQIMYMEVNDDESGDSHVIEWSEESGHPGSEDERQNC